MHVEKGETRLRRLDLRTSRIQLARDLGLTGTPTFVVAYNDGSEPQAIVGAQPADAFRKGLDDKLGDLET